jgi:hypothetical protein
MMPSLRSMCVAQLPQTYLGIVGLGKMTGCHTRLGDIRSLIPIGKAAADAWPQGMY